MPYLKTQKMEFGLCTFADMNPGGDARQRLLDLLEEFKLADELGLDVFGLGEHHRSDYAVSNPATVLAAAAVLTKNIKLSSAVTVLSSDDPVRVFQQFATVDLLSGGRAEIMAGRGSFTESFPLFGYDLGDYDALFSEKLDLLMRINASETLSWQGTHRPEFYNRGVYPRPFKGEIPIWLAVGGTPASAVRAATLGLPLMLALIGGAPEQFVPFINLYKNAAVKAGRDLKTLPLGLNNHLFVGRDSQTAADTLFPHYAAMMDRVGRDRGWPAMTRQRFDMAKAPGSALLVGSVAEVVDKILYQHELFGFTRYLGQISLGTVPHRDVMASIELYGSEVVPAVKKALRVQ